MEIISESVRVEGDTAVKLVVFNFLGRNFSYLIYRRSPYRAVTTFCLDFKNL